VVNKGSMHCKRMMLKERKPERRSLRESMSNEAGGLNGREVGGYDSTQILWGRPSTPRQRTVDGREWRLQHGESRIPISCSNLSTPLSNILLPPVIPVRVEK
jgi:hypothetical protein